MFYFPIHPRVRFLTQLAIVEVDSLIELVVRNVTDMQHKPGRRKDIFPGVCEGANFVVELAGDFSTNLRPKTLISWQRFKDCAENANRVEWGVNTHPSAGFRR